MSNLREYLLLFVCLMELIKVIITARTSDNFEQEMCVNILIFSDAQNKFYIRDRFRLLLH